MIKKKHFFNSIFYKASCCIRPLPSPRPSYNWPDFPCLDTFQFPKQSTPYEVPSYFNYKLNFDKGNRGNCWVLWIVNVCVKLCAVLHSVMGVRLSSGCWPLTLDPRGLWWSSHDPPPTASNRNNRVLITWHLCRNTWWSLQGPLSGDFNADSVGARPVLHWNSL